MSSIMIIQEHEKFTFAVDTARCWGDEDFVKYRDLDEKVQKVHKAGRDMVFIAGMTECTEKLKRDLHQLVNKKNHVNIELLKQYLKREFPLEKSKYKDTGLSDIGVAVLSVINNESVLYGFDQDDNFNEIAMSKAKPSDSKLYVYGLDGKRIYNFALKYLRSLKNVAEYRKPDTFIHVYQNNYSEGVGGYIQVYSMDSDGCNMIQEHKLDEEGLRYVIYESALKRKLSFAAHITAGHMIGGTINGTDINGVNIYGSHIRGGDIEGVSFRSNFDEADPNEAYMTLNSSTLDFYADGGTHFLEIGHSGIRGYHYSGHGNIRDINIIPFSSEIEAHSMRADYLYEGYNRVITNGNIGAQSVNYSTTSGYLQRAGASGVYVYVSANSNFRPASPLMGSCGTSDGLWTAVYAQNGTIQTSDVRKKTDITPLTDKYMQFAKKLLKLPRTYKMLEGQSGRTHVGLVAQDVETAMTECGITDMEFAGLIKSPVYAKRLIDENGNETPDYDTTSEIIDYNYGLRYDEFIGLLLAKIDDLEERLSNIEK